MIQQRLSAQSEQPFVAAAHASALTSGQDNACGLLHQKVHQKVEYFWQEEAITTRSSCEISLDHRLWIWDQRPRSADPRPRGR